MDKIAVEAGRIGYFEMRYTQEDVQEETKMICRYLVQRFRQLWVFLHGRVGGVRRGVLQVRGETDCGEVRRLMRTTKS